jgi:hypothetical protein
MNTITGKDRKRKPWELAAELLFVGWVIVVNILYYSQFKDLVLRHLGKLFHR